MGLLFFLTRNKVSQCRQAGGGGSARSRGCSQHRPGCGGGPGEPPRVRVRPRGPAARRGRASPAGGAGSPSGPVARKFPADSYIQLFVAFICIIFYKSDRILYGRPKIPDNVYFDAGIIYLLVLFCLQSFKDVNAIILQYSKRLLLLLKGAYEDFDCI